MSIKKTFSLSGAIAVALSAAPAAAFTDADDFGSELFGGAYGETTEYAETWDTIPTGYTAGQAQSRYTINSDFGNAVGLTVGGGGFPKLSNPDLGLGANGDGLDPRDGTIVLYSSVRFGVEAPRRGRTEVAIGSGGVDSANDVHPRLIATNVWSRNSDLVDTVLASEGALGNPGFSQDALDFEPTIIESADFQTDTNPFYTAGSFDASKYVHFAAAIRLLDESTGAYETLGWFRSDASSDWTLYYRNRIEDDLPFSLGDIGADHPFLAGVKQGFVNSLGFVSIPGADPNEVFYGRHAITQLNSNLLDGDYNLDGVVDVADYTGWRDAVGSEAASALIADSNGDGVIDDDDYNAWVTGFGSEAGGAGILAVPEPSAALLAAGFLAASLPLRRAAAR